MNEGSLLEPHHEFMAIPKQGNLFSQGDMKAITVFNSHDEVVQMGTQEKKHFKEAAVSGSRQLQMCKCNNYFLTRINAGLTLGSGFKL